jgi:trafficking protein particle complex subunit 10
MSLHEEALSTYEELEVLFFQVLKDKTMSWFGSLVNPSARDDSAALLSVDRKPFRDLILANSISVFDFRMYLLARQCILLSSMGKLVEVGRKAILFLQTFGKRLQEVEVSTSFNRIRLVNEIEEDEMLPPFFVESWTYCSALSVVDQCDAWARSLQLDKPTMAGFSAVKGELVELARHQVRLYLYITHVADKNPFKLDALGIAARFLPSRPPFSVSCRTSSTNADSVPSADFSRISRADLQAALTNKEAFFEMYAALTNRAIDLYVAAGRRKFALRMHGSLAALDV